jgi:phosphonate transport system substrate-binding protein
MLFVISCFSFTPFHLTEKPMSHQSSTLFHRWSRAIGAVMLAICGQISAWCAEETIRITGIPDENPTELARKYQPMVTYLESKLGVKVTYIPVTDYGAAVSAMVAGKIDFAWLGGFTHVQARVLSGAKPVVMRDIDRKFRSVFIAGADSGIQKPEDFKGKSFAFGSKSSTSGHLMPRHFLISQLKLNPETDFSTSPVYSGAHDATVKLVESGKVQGGVLNSEVWERLLSTKKVDQTKVHLVWTTPEYVDYVWTARKDLDANTVLKFKEAFLALSVERAADKEVLSLQGATKFVEASAADFDSIEEIARKTGLLK